MSKDSKVYDNRSKAFIKEQNAKGMKRWSDALDDDAFGDDVIDEGDHRRLNLVPSINPYGGSSFE